MKTIGLKVLLSASLLIFSSLASASLMIEPFLGYESGKIVNGDSISGTNVGARIGYTALGLWLAGDYSKATLKDESSVNYALTDLALTVGYDFPIMVRGYASYVLSASNEASGGKFSGGGTKIGVGFTMLPLVSINIEMINRNYTKVKVGSLESTIDSKWQTTAISLSLPLSL